MLGQFMLTGSVSHIIGDSDDDGVAQDQVAFDGWTAKLVSNYPTNAAIPDGDDVAYIAERTISLLDDGQITEDGVTPGISLTAHDPALFDQPLQWTIKPGPVALYTGKKLRPRSWTFDAPLAGETKSLGNLTPVASKDMTSVARGMHGRSVNEVELDGTELVSYVDGIEIGRVDLGDVVGEFIEVFGYPDVVDGGSPSAPGEGTLDGGAP